MASNWSARGVRLAVLLVTVALLAAACGGDDDDSGSNGDGNGEVESQSIEVTAAGFAFDPSTIEAEPGQEVTVTLVNNDEAPHTFTVEDLDASVQAAGGESADVTFTAPDSGSVGFLCEIHPEQMTGEITVDGAAASSESSSSGGRGAYDLDE